MAETVPLAYAPDDLAARVGDDWATVLTDAYGWMVLARTLDRRMLGLQRQGRIGFYGPATGQEAVSVAAGLVSRPDDWVVPGLREQLVALVRGHPLTTYAHHLFANSDDPSLGRQMPCHPSARDVHYLSMSSVIGTQLSHAVGIAYAQRQRSPGAVTFGFFGDGATSANDFHAGLNFAAVFGLPVVFCLTNNQWAISMPVERQTHVAELHTKSAAYGIPGSRVDGTDFVECYRALKSARDSAGGGAGPSLIEFVVYRMTPHSSSDDPKRYQAPEWAERAEAHDPVQRLERLLSHLGLLDAGRRESIAASAEERVGEAIRVAESRPPPDPSSLASGVFAAPTGAGG